MIQKITEFSNMFQKRIELPLEMSRIRQSFPKGTRAFQEVPEYFRMFQRFLECPRIFLNVPECFKEYHRFPEYSRNFQKAEKPPDLSITICARGVLPHSIFPTTHLGMQQDFVKIIRGQKKKNCSRSSAKKIFFCLTPAAWTQQKNVQRKDPQPDASQTYTFHWHIAESCQI